ARTAPVFHARPNCTRCGLLSDACDGRRIAQTLGRVASRCLAPRGAPVVHRSELRSRAMKFTTSVATLTALGITAALAVASPAAAGAGPENVVTPGAGTAEYRLVSGDKLRIEVYKDAQLSQSLQIRPDGKITLPLRRDAPRVARTDARLRRARRRPHVGGTARRHRQVAPGVHDRPDRHGHRHGDDAPGHLRDR